MIIRRIAAVNFKNTTKLSFAEINSIMKTYEKLETANSIGGAL